MENETKSYGIFHSTTVTTIPSFMEQKHELPSFEAIRYELARKFLPIVMEKMEIVEYGDPDNRGLTFQARLLICAPGAPVPQGAPEKIAPGHDAVVLKIGGFTMRKVVDKRQHALWLDVPPSFSALLPRHDSGPPSMVQRHRIRFAFFGKRTPLDERIFEFDDTF